MLLSRQIKMNLRQCLRSDVGATFTVYERGVPSVRELELLRVVCVREESFSYYE